MNTEMIFLFVILLLGILLSLFLGSKSVPVPFTENIDAEDIVTESFHNGNPNYDNYNHYSGVSNRLANGSTLYGPNGGKVIVNSNSDGSQYLTVTIKKGQKPIIFTNYRPIKPSAAASTSTSQKIPSFKVPSFTIPSFTVPAVTVPAFTTPSFTPPPSSTLASLMSSFSNMYNKKDGFTSLTNNNTRFYGPNGEIASVINSSKGQQTILVTTLSGTYTYTSYIKNNNSNSNSISSTQYYGSTGSPVQPSIEDAYTTKPLNGAVTDYGSKYYSALPQGVPKSQIPSGQEDLYILKSQVVPPVCPACQVSKVERADKKCPPCPACARCPEPSMTCKAVPNYKAIDANNPFLPQPVISDFSQFGM